MTDEKQWYVYLLECKDDSLYTGITNDVAKRMIVHKSGKGSKYVKTKRFNRLLYTIKVHDKIEAAQIEYKIKQLSRNDKISFFVQHKNVEYSVLDKEG